VPNPVAGEPETEWWTTFGDPELVRLIEFAIDENRDLMAAEARLGRAEAEARIAGADLKPSVGLGATASGRRNNPAAQGLDVQGFSGPRTFTQVGVSVDVSWEIDLWVRIRAGVRAAVAELQASEADLRGARQSIAAQTAKAWFAVVEALQQVDLELATLRELNPAIRRDLTPAVGRTTIRLPLGYEAKAEAILASTPKSEWAPRMMHSVRSGESLYSIAQRYGSSVSAIRQANGIRGNLIHPGQTLVVPRFGNNRPQRTHRVASGNRYVVQRNDTLWDISRSFGTSVDELCAANGLSRRSTIQPGQTLAIPTGGGGTAASKITGSSTTYKVRRGDTLYDIARKFGVSVSALRQANGLTSSRIYPGDVLRIPGSRARG